MPYHFSLFMICHAESSFLEHFCFRALDHLLLVLRIRHPDSFIMELFDLKIFMLGMGFEPMNFVVSNLEFDALDRSANLTYEKYCFVFFFPVLTINRE